MEQINIEYLTTKTGDRTMKLNGFLLHSVYNPITEAKNFAEQYFKRGHVNILFGYGCGHIVKELESKLTAEEKLIVVDPTIKPINQGNFSFSNYAEKDSLFNFFGTQFNFSHLVNVIVSPNYDKALPEQYKIFLAAVKEKLRNDQVNENTFRSYTKQWQRNYYLNLRAAVRDKSILELKQRYNCPIVIASGGPSLTKQLDIIKKYRNNIILISSGSTINSLLKAGIEPDYAMSIDGLEKNYENYRGLGLKNTHLLYTMDNHVKVRWEFSNKSYYFLHHFANKAMGNLEDYLQDTPVAVPNGMSVANSAFAFSIFTSTGPICLIGQDLAFTNNQSHAADNKSFEALKETPETDELLVYDVGYYGDKVISNNTLIGMKKSFEKMASQVNRNNIFNCTEGGVLIKGFENMPFEVFCEKFATSQVEIFDVETEEITQQVLAKKLQHLKMKSLEEKELCKQISNLCKKNLDLLKSNVSTTQFQQNILAKLDKNDKKIVNATLKSAISISMIEIDNLVIRYFKVKNNETPKETYRRVYRQSEFYYTKINEAAREIIMHIDELNAEINAELEMMI